MTDTATFLRTITGMRGDMRLYQLDPPMTVDPDYHFLDKDVMVVEFVVVSAVTVPYSGPETYIFAADEKGNVLDWGELPGSLKGGMDHEIALASAGYQIVPEMIATSKAPKAIEGA